MYRATNVSLGRKVAIKLLGADMAHVEEDVLRFLREARAAAAVRHPNVVDVLDVARDDDGTPFIVQELLSGEDLESYEIARGGPISIEESLAIMLPVVEAVAAAHERGVVHRDLKPGNVFLSRDEGRITPKVLDFGACIFATLAGNGEEEMRTVLGTPHYMAPEQLSSPPVVDARADVWAIGVMLWEMAVGQAPFDGPSSQHVIQLVKTRAVPRIDAHLPGVPAPFADLVAACTQRDPSLRPMNGRALLARMRQVADDVRMLLHGRRDRLHESEVTPPEGVVFARSPAPPVVMPPGGADVAIELDTSVPAWRASSPDHDLGGQTSSPPPVSTARASRASFHEIGPRGSSPDLGRGYSTSLPPLSSARPSPARTAAGSAPVQHVDWARVVRPAGKAFGAALAVHVALRLVPLTAPLGAALRGDSLVASAALALTVLVTTALLVARAVAASGRPRSLAFTAGAGVLLSIAMIIVTFAASEAAALGASSSAGLLPVLAPLLPGGLAVLALRRMAEAEHERDAALARRFLVLAAVAMLAALEAGPTGAVWTVERAAAARASR